MKKIAFITLFWLSILGLLIFLLATNEWIHCRIFGEQTAYSKGFDEAVFRAITRGQTVDEVRSRLGPPLRIADLDNGRSSWIYSKSPPDSTIHNYKIRIVRFNADKTVEKKVFGLYLD